MSDAFKYGAILSIVGVVLFAFACAGSYYLPKYRAKKAVSTVPAIGSKEDDESSEVPENNDTDGDQS